MKTIFDMIKITLSEYNALPKDYRGIWGSERDDLPNWAEIRDKYLGKRTMLHNDNDATVLLVEGLGFEIVEGDFYNRKFHCGNSYVSREELEGFPCPFCTKGTTDAQMQRIVEEADAVTRECWRIPADQPIDFKNDEQDDTWWKELENAAVRQGIPYYDDIIEPVYHGSPDPGVLFSTDGGRVVYFTDSRTVAEEFAWAEGRGGLRPGETATLIHARITLRHPYVARSEEEWLNGADDANIDKRKWMAEGYDGICYRNEHGVTYYAVFDVGNCEILKREPLADTGPEELPLAELARRIYNLPAGQTLHFKCHADRDLYGVIRLDMFECDTLLISYYGGGNTSVFDAIRDYSADDIASWLRDVIEAEDDTTVYLIEEEEFNNSKNTTKMNLNHYYAKNKDRINSSIMEIASELAVGRMVDKYKQPFEAFVKPDDPDDPDGGTHYKEEFQDEYNRFYDEEYERVASLMRFDIGAEDGIRKEEDADDSFASLVGRANAWQKEARERIVETLRRHGGRVTYTPEEEDSDYPVTSSLYGRRDCPRINITDVYLEEGAYIMADGIDTDGDKRNGFQIYDEQLYDIALFLKWVL